MIDKKYIIRNIIQTPDGTVLESRDRNDSITYVDKITKKDYFVDGGLAFVRTSKNGDEAILTIYSNEPFYVIRQSLMRGTYGEDGNQPYKRVPLMDIDTAHIVKTIKYIEEYQKPVDKDWAIWYVSVLNQELGWRAAIESIEENKNN